MDVITTKDPKFTLRFATPEDAGLVVELMKKLGDYQNMLDRVTITEEEVKKLFLEKKGEAVLGNYEGETVALAYFYHSSSAFIGKTGMYIDALYVEEAMRFKGLGKIIMAFLSTVAVERGCHRLEWVCFDWNEPSVHFYHDLGAIRMDQMAVYRFSPEKLREMADLF